MNDPSTEDTVWSDAGTGTTPLTPSGTRPPQKAPESLIGRVIEGRFRVRLVLGEGGQGKVYLAEDLKLNNRRVAVKLLDPSLTVESEFRTRFAREALLQANLPHPQIVQILDTGESAEGAWIVMEYSDGRPLSTLIKELGRRPLEKALDVIEQLLEILDFAHRQNVVHRDLKPRNILIEERPGRELVRVLDFGIAKLLGTDPTDELAQTLTRPGYAFGTLGYMAPEQARGDPATDHRADLYSVGVIFHEMLAGQVPTPPESRTHPIRYAIWVSENPIPRLAKTHPDLGVPEPIDGIINKALSREPSERHQSALAFLSEVRDARKQALRTRIQVRPTIAETAPTIRSGSSAHAPGGARGVAVAGWLVAVILAGVCAYGWREYRDAVDRAALLEREVGSIPADVTASLARFEGDLARSDADLAARTRERDEAKGEADVLRGQVSALQDKIGGLNDRITSLGSASGAGAEAQAQLTLKDGIITELERQLEAERARLTAETGRRDEELEQHRSRLRESQESGEQARAELNTARTERDALSARLATREAEIDRILNERRGQSELAAELVRTKAIVEELRRREAGLVAEKERLEGLLRGRPNLGNAPNDGGRPRDPVPSTPPVLVLTNGDGQRIQVRRVEVTLPDGSTRDATLPSDRELSSQKSIDITLFPGARSVTVTFWKFDWRNRRMDPRDLSATANVAGSRTALTCGGT